MSTVYLQFEAITKSFPGVSALQRVTFGATEGSVHALLGENGAGKSTLLKILSGAYRPDAGSIHLGGRSVSFSKTADALANGVAVIYQELQLVPQLTVAENLFLGHLPRSFGLLKRGELLERARNQLLQLGEAIDPTARVADLSIGSRQMVEIAKALTYNAKVIAFDEPTSSLSARETEKLFATIDRLKRDGKVILYVSHRMDEIFRVCDAATVLRDGKHIETFKSLEGVTSSTLVQRMVGRSIDDVYRYQPRPRGEVVLEVEDLVGPGVLQPASLKVRAGEIVGIFGLVGAGRTELLKLIYGATRASAGSIRVNGKPVSGSSPRSAIRSGIVLCPEDRKKEGIVAIRSVMENLNISGRRHWSPFGLFMSYGRERENAKKFVDRLTIRTPGIDQPIGLLSGGNQQKVILSRWLSEEVKVILLDEPTRGIDIGAKSEIYTIINELAAKGVAVIMVSSELPEVLGVADRLLVMREGALVKELSRDQATQETALQAALPIARHEEVVSL